MKKILVILGFLFVNFGAYADGHSGKIHLEGFGAWSLNVMNAGNGNLSITYDGLYSGVAMDGTKFGNNSSVQCVGGLTTSKGKFNDETGICKFLFANGDTAFTKYTGSGEVGKNGSATFEFLLSDPICTSCDTSPRLSVQLPAKSTPLHFQIVDDGTRFYSDKGEHRRFH